MAIVQTFKQRETTLQACIKKLEIAIASNRAAEKYQGDQLRAGAHPQTIRDQITGSGQYLDQAEDEADAVKTLIDDLNWELQDKVQIDGPGAYDSASVDVSNGSSRGEITAANSSTPYSVFSAADKVQLSGAETAAHDGVYTVQAATTPGNTIEFSAAMSGADNTDDTTLQLTLLER